MPLFDDPLPFDAGDPFDAEPGAFDADTPFDGGDFELLLFDPSDKALALRVGADANGLPIFAGMDGFCGSFPANARLLALVVGTDEDGKPILAVSKQRCEGTGTNFEVGKLYLALVVGADDDGKPILASFCEQCDGDPPPTIITCDPESPCDSVEVPAEGFTLSITATTDADCLPTGDYALTYQEDILVARQLDQSEQPCIVTVETHADGLFTELIPVDVDECNYPFMRYSYDPCTGVLGTVYQGPFEDCTNEDNTVAEIGPSPGTLDIVDCDPYFAEILGGFAATVS
jgi:hypothetical protein